MKLSTCTLQTSMLTGVHKITCEIRPCIYTFVENISPVGGGGSIC